MADDKMTDVEFIRALAELLRETELTELEVSREAGEDNELKVRLSRHIQVAAYAPPAAAPAPAPSAAPAAPAAPPAPEDPALDPNAVTSPMVGTAFLAPEPGAPAFVTAGDRVAEGQTLLIVEAMKTMNQIPAPRSGKVTRILVDDGSAVEFGTPLVIIE